MRHVFAMYLGLAVCAWATPVAAQEGARRDEAKPEPPPEPTLTKPPALVQGAAPEYPPDELAAKREAQVLVRIDIDAEGAVSNVEVVTSAGAAFDAAAIAAAKQYIFSPAEWDGTPGPITVETAINFVIEVVEEPDEPVERADPDADDYERGPPNHGGDMNKPIGISGVALERGTRSKLAGVIVSVVELGLDAVTDEKGRFYFHGVPAGNYTIVAVDDGYDKFKRTLDVGKRERVSIKLYLRKKGGNPYETVVEGESQVFEVTKRSIQRRQMTTVPGTFGDPIRVVQSLPGLSRTPFVSGFLLIRGSFPGDSGVFVDGHEVPLLFHFLGGPSFLNPEFLEELELYPGGYPVRFGRAQGGIVAVETRTPKGDGIHGSADVDFLDAGGYLRFPVGKDGGIAFAARRSYLNLLLPFFLPEPDEGDTLIVTPVYQDYNARYDHDLHEHGKLTFFLFGSSDRLDVVSVDSADESSFALDTSISFFRIISTYKRKLTSDLGLTLSTAWGKDSVRFAGAQFESSDPENEIDITQTALSYRMRVNGKLSERMRLDTGIEVASRITRFKLLVPIDDDFRSPVGEQDIPSEILERSVGGLNMAAYVELAMDVGRGVRLIPGLRFDSYVLAGQPRASFDPRLVARWAIDKQWTAKSYVGLFNQPPQPERFDVRFGNPDLELEYAVHTGVGGEYKPNRDWLFDGEVYYIPRRNQAIFTDKVTELEDGTIQPLRSINTASGLTYGAELLIRRNVTDNQFGWLSYTLSYTKFRTNDEDDLDFTTFDQRHTLNLVYSYTTKGGWELGARYRLATGRPDTPIVDSTFDVDNNRFDPLTGEFRSTRRKTFQQLDVRAEKTWLFNTWSMGVYLDVQNALNTENVEATQYDYRFRDSSPVTSTPIIPSLGVRGRF